MARQSEALSAETQAMRRIDLALQGADDLTGLAKERVLRYASDQVADRRRVRAEISNGDGYTHGGGGTGGSGGEWASGASISHGTVATAGGGASG